MAAAGLGIPVVVGAPAGCCSWGGSRNRKDCAGMGMEPKDLSLFVGLGSWLHRKIGAQFKHGRVLAFYREKKRNSIGEKVLIKFRSIHRNSI